MRREFVRYVSDPLYWLVLAAGLSARTVMAWLDREHRPEQFWSIAGNYWSLFGSVTMAILVLLVLIHLFSMDRETRTAPVIRSTLQGRGTLFRDRLLAGCGAAALAGALLAAGNLLGAILLSPELPVPVEWSGLYLRSSLAACLGAVVFFLLSASVCDMIQNQPAATGICGAPLILSYMLGYQATAFYGEDFFRPDVWWPLRCGWFTPLMRGRLYEQIPWFFVVWYILLVGGAVLLALRIRKGRKEL